MLVNAAQMLKDAEAGHYALGAFNTNNHQSFHAPRLAPLQMTAISVVQVGFASCLNISLPSRVVP